MEGYLIAKGKVIGQKPSTFEGKTSLSIQIMKRNIKGAIELLNIKLPEGTPSETYPEGSDVEFAVDVVAVESSAYYRFVRDLKASAQRTASKPTAAI
jgi:hypothetical protein